VRLVVADRLAETLRPGINVAEERGVVSVRRVKVSGELRSDGGEFRVTVEED
jgi:hypothetical protein